MSDLMTQPGRRKRRRTGRAALIAVAVTTAVVGAAGVAFAFGWGTADKQPAATPSGPSVALQTECSSIRRGYVTWRDAMGLADLDAFKDVDPGAVTPNLAKEGDALLRVVQGYPDQRAKDLAVAVAAYNVEVGMLDIEVRTTDTYKQESFRKANAARLKVNDTYNAFWATCALSGVS